MEPEEFKEKFDKIIKEHKSSKTASEIHWLISVLEILFKEWRSD